MDRPALDNPECECCHVMPGHALVLFLLLIKGAPAATPVLGDAAILRGAVLRRLGVLGSRPGVPLLLGGRAAVFGRRAAPAASSLHGQPASA